MSVRPQPPDLPAGRGGGRPRPEDGRAAFPPKGVLVGLTGLVVGNLLAVVGYGVGAAITPHEQLTALLLSELLLWSGMIGACWWAGQMYGTRSFRADFAIRPRRTDLGWGALFAVADWVAATLVTRLVSLLGKSYAGSNSNIVTDVRSDIPALAATVAFAVIGAPIVEELFFRGLMQRSLEPMVGWPLAVALQALLFGGVHVAETSGSGRLGLWLALSAVGAVHGLAYQRFKRITVSMWAHALFNVGGVVLIFTATIRV